MSYLHCYMLNNCLIIISVILNTFFSIEFENFIYMTYIASSSHKIDLTL